MGGPGSFLRASVDPNGHSRFAVRRFRLRQATGSLVDWMGARGFLD